MNTECKPVWGQKRQADMTNDPTARARRRTCAEGEAAVVAVNAAAEAPQGAAATAGAAPDEGNYTGTAGGNRVATKSDAAAGFDEGMDVNHDNGNSRDADNPNGPMAMVLENVGASADEAFADHGMQCGTTYDEEFRDTSFEEDPFGHKERGMDSVGDEKADTRPGPCGSAAAERAATLASQLSHGLGLEHGEEGPGNTSGGIVTASAHDANDDGDKQAYLGGCAGLDGSKRRRIGATTEDAMASAAAAAPMQDEEHGQLSGRTNCGRGSGGGTSSSSEQQQPPPPVDDPDPQAQAQPGDPAPPEHAADTVSKSVRRRMVLEQLAEARKRRRLEGEAIDKAWGGLVAAIGVQDLLNIPADEEQPPDGAHATHCLVQCGGYLGCVRCGRVVGWQGRERLKEVCRGTCPRGSVRAIRRLTKGQHPYERDGQSVATAWPNGETAPRPRRWRAGVG